MEYALKWAGSFKNAMQFPDVNNNETKQGVST